MSVHTQLFIDGAWTDGVCARGISVLNPATGEASSSVAHACLEDLERAALCTEKGFREWRRRSAFERSKLLRRAADLLRERVDTVARAMTLEEGKPLHEARAETMSAADVTDWFAEEARRTYGRVIPSRSEEIYQLVIKEPIGPVAAFSPWNFPVVLAVRKIAAALAAGCSVVLKGPEEAPACCAALVGAFQDAGLPPGALNLLFGEPAEISEFLIPHPAIRKISFTGSTGVGKHLASLAGLHMKRVTMELGGHAPVIVFNDADVSAAARSLAGLKYRNAGQVCIAPTRFLIQQDVYDRFAGEFIDAARKLKLGDGLDPATTMGPLANQRRVQAMERMVEDAVEHGAKIETGGSRVDGPGFFFNPTVLANTSVDACVRNEEPFGPVATLTPFRDFEDAMREANRLPYGLAAFAYTRSVRTATRAASAIESGMITINHHGLALPEVPFGGIKDSGYGSESGPEAIDSYMISKLVTQAGIP
jgi:succinate-semialdehyde dehydrogenase/glutarate-semialdehyde dehydrogenase